MFARARIQFVAGIAGALILVIAPVLPRLASAATFAFSPTPVSGNVGRPFTVSISVESDKPFNAGGATLKYDPAYLTPTNLSKDGSGFTIWAEEPAFSASDGTITFGGGNTAALSGGKKVLGISFMPKKEGSTQVSFVDSKGSIIAADGSGAETYQPSPALPVTIAPGSAVPPAPDPNAAVKTTADTSNNGGTDSSGSNGQGDLPEAPIITSTTHPKQDAYFNAPTAKFSWDLPLDVTVVRAEMDQSSSTVPKQTFDPAITDKEFSNYKDGLNYIHVRYKNGAGWGPTATYAFMSDRVAPKPFTVTARVPDKSADITLAFSTTDDLSGMEGYDISIDGGQPKKISLEEVKDGTYPLLAVPNGSHSAKITAYDNAGNTTSAEVAFLINAPVKADSSTDQQQQQAGISMWGIIGIALLFATIGALIGIIWYERNSFRHEKFVTKREADEVRDRIASVFAALREEVDEQLNRLFQKPNPTAEDREVMRRVHEAMDLSEELLAKEAEDVRKLLMR